ncbi:PREDICTED: UPF0161 protein At3g09310 [Tarenaya hassleriana]|uniref:UPF0161 protein At3g09310 n=1 Tax=Tarenaya hassleriana TaxID=28532 RepID=UPI00053C6F1A|nr:PREDICTED: UPF0161 protein At3g09310 [Tarenaya hassleriana]
MVVVFSSSHCPNDAHLLVSVNPNGLKSINFPQKSSKTYLKFHSDHRKIAQLRCSSSNGSPSNSDPDSPQDGEVENLGVKAALAMLRFYKREISPVIPRSCRYVPTCSEYSMEAYKKYGVVKGTALTAWRLCRCNPLGGSGFDPPRWFGETRLGEEEEEDGADNENNQQITMK